MPKTKPLPPEKLRAALDPQKLTWDGSDEVKISGSLPPFQPRAREAFELGLAIRGRGYNIYLAGEAELGRSYFIRNLLGPRAAKAAAPPDYVYLHNFEDPDRPLFLRLPAGDGKKLKADLCEAVTGLREEIPARFEQDVFLDSRDSLVKRFKSKREKLYSQAEKTAASMGFSLVLDESGTVTVSPVVGGKTLTPDDFDQLEQGEQQKLRDKRNEILDLLATVLRKIQVEEQGLKENEESLERRMAAEVVKAKLAPLAANYAHVENFATHLKALEEDVLESLDHFAPREEPQQNEAKSDAPAGHAGADDDFFDRYGVNLFVDNSRTRGAPVIFEDHPTYFNLLGCIERESELGALYTDFTLIKAGSLARANHGFLVIQAEDLLANPSAWEGLIRALRAGQIRIEDPPDFEQAKTRTVEPEPIDLDIKVVLIGTDELYETLLFHDMRFKKHFKIKAHMQEAVKRSAANIRSFVRETARMIRETELLPFSRGALAAAVDFSSRLASDQSKLSLQFPLIRDMLIESSALAAMRGEKRVSRKLFEEADRARDFRANLYEEEFMADYDREIIKVPTRGSAVGRVNGLSVTYFGDYVFGLPHQIACTVGVGEGGIIDLEREAQLGGPIHTKAMMILKSYLLDRFAHDKPLVLAGSLYFEQSYAHVEGDSASGAELAALLSALAETPIDLSYAFTGAVNQSGAVMAVGDVTRKVEGFYEVCRRRRENGPQGVIIPQDNVVNLMLKPEIVEAVRRGRFRIHPVRTIEQALEILTGVKAGARRKDGSFTRGSLYRLVDERLRRLAGSYKRFKTSR